MGSPLDNQLLRDNQLAANQFTGETYQDVLDWYDSKPIGSRPTPDDFNTYQTERALEGLEQDANGHYYNGDNERVYVYRDSAELGDDSNGFKGENIVMRTEAEIREAWEADEGMGYFKEANPQMDVDTYMEFIAEKDSMYASGVLDLNPHDDVYNTGHKGRGPNADAINAVLAEEKSRVQAAEAQANATLNDKYGIQTSFTNEDGDQFEFNGATYTKTYKVDDHLGVGDYVKMGAGVLMSVYAGPMIAGSLGSFMGPAMAKAASSAIISQATALMNGQGLSIGDALQSAALSYGGSKLGDMFASGGELSGTVSEITDKVTSTTDKLNEFLSTGNSIADAAIKAGGMSMLTSLVMTGEVDLESAGLAALMAGGAEGLGKLNSGLLNQGAEGIELEEVVVTAQKKGVEVADGLTKLENGMVINSTGDIMGTMDDLDLDGDGVLNANDLQNITTDNQFVSDKPPSEDPFRKNGARVYLDSEGNVYTQDQIGNYVDGSKYGDIYMVDGQEILLEQGTMVNGRMMFDGDGDGVFDVVYNDKGRVVGSYNPETREWEDASGNTSASIGEYMRTVNPTTGESGIENPFNMSREAYEAMTGEEYVKDLFALKATAGGTGVDGMLLALDDGEIAEMVARFEKHPYADPKTGDLLYGKEALERYLQNEEIGVNYSEEHGWRLETNVDTSDGIYGTMNDSKSVDDILGAPDTTKDSDIRTIADIETAVPIDDDPFTDPVEPEPIEPEKTVQKDTEDSSSLNGAEGSTGDSGSTPSTPSSSDYNEIEIAQIAQASNLPLEAVIAALNAGATPEQIVNDPAIANDPSKIISEEDGDVIPTDGTGTPVAPPMNVRIEELMAGGMTYEQAVANQNAAIKAGADANNDGMVTNSEWSAHTTGDVTDSKDTVTDGSNSTTGKDVADNTVVTDGGDNVTNGTSKDGTGDEVVAGDKTGSDAVDDGTGAKDDVTTTGPGVTGTDNGPGDGPVEGPGGNGPGGNGPGGNGMMGMAGSGGGVPFEKFSQLDPYVWQKFQKRRNPLINTAPTPTQNRRSLLSGLWNEAMK